MRVRPLLTTVDLTRLRNDKLTALCEKCWERGSRVWHPLTKGHSDWLKRKRKKKKGRLTNLRIFVVICLSVRLRDVIQELKQRRFLSGAHQPEVVFFAFFGSGFAQIFAQIVFIYVKTLRYTNLVASSHTKRNKDSVSVDVRRSKKSLLKLPIYPLVPGKKTVSAFA